MKEREQFTKALHLLEKLEIDWNAEPCALDGIEQVFNETTLSLSRKLDLITKLSDKIPMEYHLKWTRTVIDSTGALHLPDFGLQLQEWAKQDAESRHEDAASLNQRRNMQILLTREYFFRVYNSLKNWEFQQAQPVNSSDDAASADGTKKSDENVQRYIRAFQDHLDSHLASEDTESEYLVFRPGEAITSTLFVQQFIPHHGAIYPRTNAEPELQKQIAGTVFRPVTFELRNGSACRVKEYLTHVLDALHMEPVTLSSLIVQWWSNLHFEPSAAPWKNSILLYWLMKMIGFVNQKAKRAHLDGLTWLEPIHRWCRTCSSLDRVVMLSTICSTFIYRDAGLKVRIQRGW